MVVKSKRTVHTESRVEVTTKYKGKEIVFFVKTVYGKVAGTHDNISTAYLSYFHDVPERTRKLHFSSIKKFVEKK